MSSLWAFTWTGGLGNTFQRASSTRILKIKWSQRDRLGTGWETRSNAVANIFTGFWALHPIPSSSEDSKVTLQYWVPLCNIAELKTATQDNAWTCLCTHHPAPFLVTKSSKHLIYLFLCYHFPLHCYRDISLHILGCGAHVFECGACTPHLCPEIIATWVQGARDQIFGL